MPQPPLYFIIAAFILAIGPLVYFHELGHYLVARWFGIGAETFSIGFGREITGWTDKRGTRWKVGWLPLGGYVKFVGDMNPASQPGAAESEDSRAFQNKPVWKRFLVVLAGPAANFLLAIVIFAAFFAIFGKPDTPSVIGLVSRGSAAEAAGIRPGDHIVRIAGQGTDTFEDITRIVFIRPGERVRIDLERDGQPLTVRATLGDVEERDKFGQPYRKGLLGVGKSDRVMTRLDAWQLIPEGARYTFALTRSTIDGIGQIIGGKRSAKELGGPIKMAQIAGQQASLGAFEFVQLLALFSINLGFINLLPVPMLDGGHLALYTIEAVRRRPVGERAQEWAFRGGLALLLALLLFTTANDISSIGLFGRIGRLIG